MSALVFSVLIGLAVTWTKADRTAELLEEFQKIVLEIVTRVIIPILPVFIACTFCALSYEGTITRQLPVFLKVIIIVMIGHYLWMTLLYLIAGAYSGKNPLEVVETPWSGLYYCCWNHVFCSNSCSCPSPKGENLLY